MEEKNYTYQAQIIDTENDEIVATISALSEESLMEDMGKSKWTKAIERYEEEIKKEESEINEEI